ncbi:MAG: sulfur carrier protein ThiS [Gammaproteobacteria bacterium]|jgi:sulfur carrier protein|nr:sulfur carrier protein ThiS [Gammaproteobacteria bacterium]MBT7603657.1 sulfur carrier protein ThiS [Gammaproteobacteria bacterium]
MKIILNGEEILINNNISLLDLLELKNISQKNIAIEKNRKIITKNSWRKEKLNENDIIEVITAVGGG